MRALITGIAGFAGSHLAEHLLAETAIEVHGLFLPEFGTANLAGVLDRVTLHEGNVCDYPTIRALLEECRPDLIFHLAAQAAPSVSISQPGETLSNNILGQMNVLQASVELGLAPRILAVGSADEYGRVLPDELPVSESSPLRPLNSYSVSKIAQDFLGYQYFLTHHLPVVRVRPFNHIGPRQGPGFVVADFARQIALAEAGKAEPVIHVGNLESRRDFTDVRDMVRAYHLALTMGEPGEVYNLGSGRSHGIDEILDRLLELGRVRCRVESDPARLRPADTLDLVCDGRKFAGRTGWRPDITIERTLRDVLDYWRARAQRGGC